MEKNSGFLLIINYLHGGCAGSVGMALSKSTGSVAYMYMYLDFGLHVGVWVMWFLILLNTYQISRNIEDHLI